jgi:alkanesulfonate monooxygenase SsuD/methylene tetrahydromethanopterin reductase-like flavin-dependent oxidoreductase (luciferase family)
MRIGIGLPNTLGIDGTHVAAWAKRAEDRGFAYLATIDRIVYPTFDSLTSLAVAAGATTRIGLLTNILLAPAYPPVWLAKASASLASMSGGRLTLGVGVGAREDDFAAMQRPFDQRGRLMDETLDLLRRAWAEESVAGGDLPVGPPPGDRGVPVLIGGTSDAAVRRTVAHGAGWVAGGGGPERAGAMAEKVRKAWSEGHREGEPRLGALIYFGLGDEAASRASLGRYYAFLGSWSEAIVDGALRTPQAASAAVTAFEDAGIGELAFMPTVPSIDEVDRLADAVL